MAEKGKYPAKYKRDSAFITLGLSDPEDSSLTRWNSSIIPPQGTIIGDRMYNVVIVCDSSYPDSPPKMKFCQRVHSTKFIDGATGVVNVAGLMGKYVFFSFEHPSSSFVEHTYISKQSGGLARFF